MDIRGMTKWPSWPVAGVVVVLASGIGVALLPSQTPSRGYVTPACGFARVDSAFPSDSALQLCIRRLRFDSSTGASDEQYLLLGGSRDSARLGPRASIQPEEGSTALTAGQLRTGRIIARLINRDAEAYPTLGMLPNSITYWWIAGDYQHGRGTSVYISTDREGRILRRTVRPGLAYTEHGPSYVYPRAVARWISAPNAAASQPWSPCPDRGCCRDTTHGATWSVR